MGSRVRSTGLVIVFACAAGTPALSEGPSSTVMDPLVVPMSEAIIGKAKEPAASSDEIFFEAPSQYQVSETQGSATSNTAVGASSNEIYYEAPPQPAVIPSEGSRARDLVPLGLFLALTVICLCG